MQDQAVTTINMGFAGENGLRIDIQALSRMSDEDRKAVLDEIEIFMRERFDQNPSMINFAKYPRMTLDEIKETLINELVKEIDYWAYDLESFWEETGGGVAFKGFGIIVMPSSSSALDSIGLSIVGTKDHDLIKTAISGYDFNAQSDVFHHEFVSFHEMAHGLLSLGEPGADFIATIRMLEEYPDSRDYLELFRDMRFLSPILEVGVDTYDKTALAIDKALAIYDQNLSPEEIMAHARELDRANEFYTDTTFKINRLLYSEYPEIMNSNDLAAQYRAAQTLYDRLIESGADPNHPETLIFGEVVEAFERMTTEGSYARQDASIDIPHTIQNVAPSSPAP